MTAFLASPAVSGELLVSSLVEAVGQYDSALLDELEKKIRQDYSLGQRVGIQHTPTIYIVSNTQRGKPFIEVVDRSQLYAMIDDMLKQSEPVASAKPVTHKSKAQ